MQKILFFVPSSVGGAERVTITIAKLIDRSKYDVKIVVLGSKDVDIVKFIPDYFDVIYLNVGSVKNISLYTSVYRTIRTESPDFVFASLRHVSLILLAFCRLFFRAVRPIIRIQMSPIFTQHLGFSESVQLSLSKYIYPFCYKCVTQTEEMKKEMLDSYNIDSAKIFALQNPIDTETIDSKVKEPNPYNDTENYIYVAVGRCVPQKGYDVLIKAMRKVVDINPNSRLYIVGKKSDDTCGVQLDELVAELSLKNNIHFVGFTDNPYRYVYNSDCFVLSSRIEGLPNVVLEALYLHKPVIATKCIPIIERLVEDGATGLCVNVEDELALSEAMINMQTMQLREPKHMYIPASAAEYNNLFT